MNIATSRELTIDSVTTTGNLDAKAGKNLVIDTATVGSNLTASSTGGNISKTGTVQVTGTKTLSAPMGTVGGFITELPSDIKPSTTPTPSPQVTTNVVPVQPPALPNPDSTVTPAGGSIGASASTGGTSIGGTSTVGTSAGGTGVGGTSTGEASTRGTSTGGTDAADSSTTSASAPGGKSVSGGFTDAKPLVLAQSLASSFIYAIPESTFSHSNPKAVVALEARMSDGSPLPAWMTFNPVRKVITGIPPKGVAGEFLIKIIARDQFGGEAQTVLKMNVGM